MHTKFSFYIFYINVFLIVFCSWSAAKTSSQKINDQIIKELNEENIKYNLNEAMNGWEVAPAISDQDSANQNLDKKNKIIKDEESGEQMLIGECTREAFKDSTFHWWWMSEYDLYNVDSTRLNQLKNDLKDIKIKLIMGTWCSDSRREVPRFFKILDAINYSSDKVEIICVDEDKQADGNELAGLKIELVPTFIFYKDGRELGKIEESPKETLEKDMIKILSTHS
jgi:thiol-disulfide isomerase/thioredoxin